MGGPLKTVATVMVDDCATSVVVRVREWYTRNITAGGFENFTTTKLVNKIEDAAGYKYLR